MTKSCPYCGGQVVEKQRWSSYDYRGFKLTQRVQCSECLACGDVCYSSDVVKEYLTKLDKWEATVDEWLGPENFGGVDLADSGTT